MPIKVSFSPYCIGSPKCVCYRCLEEKGKTPDAYTDFKSKIDSAIQIFQLHDSVTNILDNTAEKKIKYTNSDLGTLIKRLITIQNEI